MKKEAFGRLMLWATLLVLALPSAALAGTQPGVHIDPRSPSAKEYAIPLGQARTTGSGSSSQGTLFGGGITAANPPAPPSGGATATAPTATASPRHRPARHRRARRHARSAAPARARAHATRSDAKTVLGSGSSTGSGIVWMLGVAVLVLVAGVAGGAAVTRRGRRTSAGIAP